MSEALWLRDIVVLITANVELQLLAAEGKEFKWEKPSFCPRCRCRSIWGHGFVSAYFDGFETLFYLKRYRCQGCHCVLTLKPQGYWRKFQTDVQTIFATLSHRLAHCRWAFGVKRQRAGHWLRLFIRKVRMDFGLDNGGEALLSRLELLHRREIFFLG